MGHKVKDNRFASMRFRDEETTLDPTLYRNYSSRLGRWLTPDPASCGAGNPQNLNRYSYTANNPANRIDPTGLVYCQAPFIDSYPWGGDWGGGGCWGGGGGGGGWGGNSCADPIYAISHPECNLGGGGIGGGWGGNSCADPIYAISHAECNLGGGGIGGGGGGTPSSGGGGGSSSKPDPYCMSICSGACVLAYTRCVAICFQAPAIPQQKLGCLAVCTVGGIACEAGCWYWCS
jgi:RHS repeat-associated protein